MNIEFLHVLSVVGKAATPSPACLKEPAADDILLTLFRSHAAPAAAVKHAAVTHRLRVMEVGLKRDDYVTGDDVFQAAKRARLADELEFAANLLPEPLELGTDDDCSTPLPLYNQAASSGSATSCLPPRECLAVPVAAAASSTVPQVILIASVVGMTETVESASSKKSEFKGVSWNKGKQKWKAQITVEGKNKYLGMFDSEEDAARKYDETASQMGKPVNFVESDGQFKARRNLPRPGGSRFKGVSWNAREEKWRSVIKVSSKQYHLGLFNTEEAAAQKYDEMAGPLVRPLNFAKGSEEAAAAAAAIAAAGDRVVPPPDHVPLSAAEKRQQQQQQHSREPLDIQLMKELHLGQWRRAAASAAASPAAAAAGQAAGPPQPPRPPAMAPPAHHHHQQQQQQQQLPLDGGAKQPPQTNFSSDPDGDLFWEGERAHGGGGGGGGGSGGGGGIPPYIPFAFEEDSHTSAHRQSPNRYYPCRSAEKGSSCIDTGSPLVSDRQQQQQQRQQQARQAPVVPTLEPASPLPRHSAHLQHAQEQHQQHALQVQQHMDAGRIFPLSAPVVQNIDNRSTSSPIPTTTATTATASSSSSSFSSSDSNPDSLAFWSGTTTTATDHHVNLTSPLASMRDPGVSSSHFASHRDSPSLMDPLSPSTAALFAPLVDHHLSNQQQPDEFSFAI